MARFFSGLTGSQSRLALFLFCLLCGFFAWPTPAFAVQGGVPAVLFVPHQSLLADLDYLIDDTGTMEVEEVSAPENAASFRPLLLKNLPRENGVVWLRFTIDALAEGRKPGTILLDMGESVPGDPRLYNAVDGPNGRREWHESAPTQRKVFLLPEAEAETITCYIRMDGLPGPWFAPELRSPQNAASNWGSLARTAACLALGVVMLLCLLRGLSEKGQWRIWTALYVGVALAQGFLGQPTTGSGYVGLSEAAKVLAPGVALMLLPHVGRHLMRTSEVSRALDIQLLLLSLPGALLALLPLLPGQSWCVRYLDLWPAGTLIFVPTALGATIMGVRGAKRFLLGCLLPPLFVAAGVLGLDHAFPPNLLASAPLWGTALSALLIAATSMPRDSTQHEESATVNPREKGAAPTFDESDTAVLNLGASLDDPNLRLLPPHEGSSSSLGSQGPGLHLGGAAATSDLLENALRVPLERLLREGAALGHCSLPPAVRQYAESMLEAARDMSKIVSNPGKLRFSGHLNPADGNDSPSPDGQNIPAAPFNLQYLMREVHDAVAPAAESAGIGLAWYMPPHLGHVYEGEYQTLGTTLRLLLESAVRATSHGAVHFSVRRVPESPDAGHLLFTVKDSGSGMPPLERSSLALTKAWELAGAHKGYLGVECSPHGATIAFTLHLTYLDQTEPQTLPDDSPHVLVVSEGAVGRQMLAQLLANLPCRSSEARTLGEGLLLHQENPALLLVVQGHSADPSAAPVLGQYRDVAEKNGQPFRALAITEDDSQWDILADAGFTHALLEPLNNEDFCHTVREALDEAAQTSTTTAPAQNRAQPETAGGSPVGPAGGMPPAEQGVSFPGGRPPMPELFGHTARQDGPSLKIPDLTALPDLLSFTDSLRTPQGMPGPEQSQGFGSTFQELGAAGFDLETVEATRRKLSEQKGVPKGLFVNPYSPDDLVMRAEPLPTSASVQAEFEAAAALQGPAWAEENNEPALTSPAASAPDIATDLATDSTLDVAPAAAPVQDSALLAQPKTEPAAETQAPSLLAPARSEDPALNDVDVDAADAPNAPNAADDATEAGNTLESLSLSPAQEDRDVDLPLSMDTPQQPDMAGGTRPESSASPTPQLTPEERNAASNLELDHVLDQPLESLSFTAPEVKTTLHVLPKASLLDADSEAPLSMEPEQASKKGDSSPAEGGKKTATVKLLHQKAAPHVEATVKTGSTVSVSTASTRSHAPATPELNAEKNHDTGGNNAPQVIVIKRKTSTAAAPATTGHEKTEKSAAAPTTSGSYTSPALATPGEWVGEPMPVGSPVVSVQAVQAGPSYSGAPTVSAVSSGRVAASVHSQGSPSLAQPERTSVSNQYTSPALATPGEWVGEPMPVVKKAAPAAEAPAAKGPGSEALAATKPEMAPQAVPLVPQHALARPSSLNWGDADSASTLRSEAPQDSPLPPVTVRPFSLSSPTAAILPVADAPAAVRPTEADKPVESKNGAVASDASFLDFIAAVGPAQSETQRPTNPSLRVSATEAFPEPAPSFLTLHTPDPEPRARPESFAQTPPAGTAAPDVARALADTNQAHAQNTPGMDEAILQLVDRLDQSMEDARLAFKDSRCRAVALAAGRIAAESDAFGFRVLARLARCVEQAGKAQDMSALRDLLPELAAAVERNRIALSPRR